MAEMKQTVIREQIIFLREQYDSQTEVVRIIKENMQQIEQQNHRVKQAVLTDHMAKENERRAKALSAAQNRATGRRLDEDEVRAPIAAVKMTLLG